jgi:hypothetical protein
VSQIILLVINPALAAKKIRAGSNMVESSATSSFDVKSGGVNSSLRAATGSGILITEKARTI